MSYVPEGEEEPPQLRILRRAVLALIVVLMLGIALIAGTIVIRLGFPERGGAVLTLEQITLPDGHTIVATGEGPDRLHVTLRDRQGSESLYVFDARSGAPISVTAIIRE